MGELVDGARAVLVLQHGIVQKKIEGTLHRFEQDGETRWELVDVTETERGAAYPEHLQSQHLDAVGIVPENIVAISLI